MGSHPNIEILMVYDGLIKWGFWFVCHAQDPPTKKEPKAKAKAKSVAAPEADAAEWSSLGDMSAEFWLGQGHEPAVK